MRRVIPPALLAALLALALSATPATASGLRLTPAKMGAFPERSYLLTLPASAPLSPGQVSITENGAPVSGLSVVPASTVGQGHFGTVLLIETSASMRGSAISAALGAARSFAQQRSSQQPLGVVEFDASSRIVLPLTTDQKAIARALAAVPSLAPGTHIFNAVSVGLQMLARANVTAGAVILLSDGALTGRLAPKASEQRKAQVISAAQAQNVRVYAIGVHDRAFNSHNLQGLAAAAGGTYTEVDSAGLPSLLRELGAELSNQDVISYRSVASLGGNVQVTARVAGQPGVAIASYSAPNAPKLPASATAPTTGKRHASFWRTTMAAVLASIVCALLIGLAAMAVLRPRRSVRHRVGRFVSTAPDESQKSWTATLLERAFADDRRALEHSRRWMALVQEVELAGIALSLKQLVGLTLLGTVVLGWLLASATASPLAVVLALCVPVGVRVAIHAQVQRQRRAFDEQLPDNLQVIAAAMRAGHTFVGALAIVAEDAPEPSRRELRRVLADEQLGVPLTDALNSVTERMNSRDFEHVALVAALQRETGGNTAEVIDTVTETIRERLDLRRLVRTLTAQGRLSAWIVSALPVVLLVLISLINPHYVHPLFHRTAGVIGLGIGAVMVLSGFLVMRRIVDIKA
jgi:tight adherence protein B